MYVSYTIFSFLNYRWPKLDAQITANVDTGLHIMNDLKTLLEKFNIVVQT